MVASRFVSSYSIPKTPAFAPLGDAVEANRRKERQLEAHIENLSGCIEGIEETLVRSEVKAKHALTHIREGAHAPVTMTTGASPRHPTRLVSPVRHYVSPIKPVAYTTPTRAVVVSESEVNALHDTVQANQRRIQELTQELSGTYNEVRNETDAMEAAFQRRKASEAQNEAIAEHRRFEEANREVKSLRENVVSLQRQLESAKDRHESVHRDLLHAREQWSREVADLKLRADDAESRLHSSNAIVASAKVREASLSSEVAALRKKEEHFKSAWDELQRLKQRVSDYDAKHAEDSRTMRETTRSHEAEVLALKEQLARVTTELESTREQGSEAHAFVRELESRLQDARQALVEARSAAEGARTTGRDHEARIREQEVMLFDQGSTIQEQSDRLRDQDNRIREQDNIIREHVSRNRELDDRLIEVEARLRDTDVRAAELESGLHRARSDHENDRNHLLRELEAERKASHEQHRTIVHDAESVRSRASATLAELEIVQRKLKDAEAREDNERRLRHTAENVVIEWEARCRELEDQAHRLVLASGGRYAQPRTYVRPSRSVGGAPLPAPPSLELLREAEKILATKRTLETEDGDKAQLAMALVDAAMGLAQTAPKSPGRRSALSQPRPLGTKLDSRFEKLGTSIRKLDDKFKGYQSSATRTYETSAARAAARPVSWNDVESRANEFARVAHSARGY